MLLLLLIFLKYVLRQKLSNIVMQLELQKNLDKMTIL